MHDIFIVDDDPSVRAALATVFSGEGYQVESFGDGTTFLSAVHARAPGCILLDIHMPGCSGLDLLKQLSAERYPAPVFIISGQGDIPKAVDAIRHGALDFIEKPFDAAAIVARVREAIREWERREDDSRTLLRTFRGRDQLTAREHEVLERIAQGLSNKEAGRELGISPRTVEVHRARIMEKLRARNAADLMRIVLHGPRRH
jgi:FixJ family two-component response regulator